MALGQLVYDFTSGKSEGGRLVPPSTILEND
jgi:hypothetical protein